MNLYQYYLAADAATKRLEAINLRVDHITLDSNPMTGDAEDLQGVPYAYQWPGVRVEVDFPRDSNDIYWRLTDDERQVVREAALRAFFTRFPDTIIFRIGSEAFGYFEVNGVGVRIAFGQALCKQVETGTRIVTRPAEGAPMIEVEEPVYELSLIHI